MNSFYTFRFDRTRRRLFVIIIVIVALFIFFSKNMFNFITKNNEPAVLLKGNDEQHYVALTFNVSWGEKRIKEILDILKENDVQATFFVSGEWAERHPDYIKEITEAHHELGMLGYRYQNYVDQEIEHVRRDLIYAREVFRKLGFENMKLLRAPNGKFNEEIVNLAKNLQFDVIHWSVNTYDWKRPGVDLIVKTTLNETENGDIILMHASDSAEQTAEALRVLLPEFKNQGTNLVTITELMNQAHAKAELID